MTELERVLARFPKVRPPLPVEYRDIYLHEYLRNRQGAGLARAGQLLERWMHRKVAAEPQTFPLLEIGAGTLNHVSFEAPDCKYDAVEPWGALYDGRPQRDRIRTVFPRIGDVPKTSRYARIVSVAALEHVEDLPQLLGTAAALLAPGGTLRIAIPSEGAVLWRLAWRFGTGLAFRRRTGLDYRVVMRHEHLNSAAEIEALIRYLFREVAVSRFPLPLFHASLYTSIAAREPDEDRAAKLARATDGS